MGGQGNAGITVAIYQLIAAMAQEWQERAQPANEMLKKLDLFEKRNLPRFKGGYNPKGAQSWLQELEKIFHAL